MRQHAFGPLLFVTVFVAAVVPTLGVSQTDHRPPDDGREAAPRWLRAAAAPLLAAWVWYAVARAAPHSGRQ